MLKVERIPDEPIIIATVTGHATVDVIKEMYAQSAKLADEIGTSTIYRITDLREIEATFHDLIMSLAETSKGAPPGSPVDPRFYGAVVGSHHMLQMFSAAAKQKQYGELNIPVFSTIEEAMTYIREEITRRKDAVT